MAETRSILSKAVDKAYLYHPYGMNAPRQFDEWLVGPTFGIKAAEDYRVPADWQPLYKEDPHIQLKWSAILASANEATVVLTAKKKGHPKRDYEVTDKYGARVTKSGGKCTCRALFTKKGQPYAELGFPLYNLMNKMRPDELRVDERGGSLVVYGYKDKSLVVVLSAKGFDTCDPMSTPE